MMKTILLVEDEISLVETLTYAFNREGYEVISALDGEEALSRFKKVNPDAVVLDLMLPKISGEDVCKRIRVESDVPIVVLSAKGGETDKVVALELGADDYITKPFGMREVIARIKAAIRRSVPKEKGALVSGFLKIDRDRHEVTLRGKSLDLPLKEYQLLLLLLEYKGKVLTRSEILKSVWGENFFRDAKTVDVHVRRLRRKIEKDPDNPKMIRTVRGVGYIFEG